MTAPLVKVVNHRFVGGCRYTGYVDKSIRLFLACGHDQQRKVSQGVPARARCVECERENNKTPNADVTGLAPGKEITK